MNCIESSRRATSIMTDAELTKAQLFLTGKQTNWVAHSQMRRIVWYFHLSGVNRFD